MVDITVASVAYRQNELLNSAIRSIEKNLKSANVVKYLILDNSSVVPFKIDAQICSESALSKIEIVKNYQKQPNVKVCAFRNDYHHCMGILKAIELCQTDLMLLIDHDIILKKDLDFIDDVLEKDNIIGAFSIRSATCRQVKCLVTRACPFLMLLNVKKMKDNNIQFYDKHIFPGRKQITYSTGWQFLQTVKQSKFQFEEIDIYEYINHCYMAYARTHDQILKFLQENAKYL